MTDRREKRAAGTRDFIGRLRELTRDVMEHVPLTVMAYVLECEAEWLRDIAENKRKDHDRSTS